MTIELVIGAVKEIVIVLLVLNLTALMLWFERKGAALIQDRIGANRAAIFGIGKRFGLPNFGLIQTLMSDPIKMFTKEDFVPDGADRFLHLLAPFLALFPVLVTFAVAPMGDILKVGSHTIDLQPANLNVAALYVLATIGIGVYGIALGGWASNNRWALLGGIRTSAQMISYEIAMSLAIIAVVVSYGTLDLQQMCRLQGGVWLGFIPRWFLFLQPLGFFVFMTAGIAETNRAPFDFTEAEQELVAGYHTEYSSMSFAMFFMAEYINMVTVSAVATDLFLGGWHGPFLPKYLGWIWFLLKVSFLLFFYVWMRWTLPRYRYDQLMQFGWKVLLPLSVVNLLLTSAGVLYFGA